MKSQLLSVAGLLAALVAPACAATINFDDQNTLGGAVQLTNQYASSGVIFSDMYAAQNFKSNIFPPSTPNYASPFWVDANPGTMTFVDPSNSSINATVDSVSFTLVGLTATTQTPGFFSGATIDALDLAGNVIPGESITIPTTSTTTADQVLLFVGAIHELRFTQTAGTSGAFPIDDISMGNSSDAPEPSSLGLLGAGILLGLLRQRKFRVR